MPRLIPPRVTRLGRPGITAGQRAQPMCRATSGRVGPGARPDVGVVDHEAGIAGFEGQPGLVFARGGQCGIGGRRVGKPSHDRQRALRGRLLERHMLPVGRQHRSARRREQRNEEHGESLVALALGLDGAVRAETLSHAEQRIPGTRRCVHAVAAVPEQLGVGGEGFRPQAPLVGCAGDRAGEPARAGLAGTLALPGQHPARLRELGGPDDVHADNVDVRVAGRQAAHKLLALLVGVGWQRCELDVIAAVRRARRSLARPAQRRPTRSANTYQRRRGICSTCSPQPSSALNTAQTIVPVVNLARDIIAAMITRFSALPDSPAAIDCFQCRRACVCLSSP